MSQIIGSSSDRQSPTDGKPRRSDDVATSFKLNVHSGIDNGLRHLLSSRMLETSDIFIL